MGKVGKSAKGPKVRSSCCEGGDPTCSGINAAACSCKVEAILTVDERGQMVLPKDVRDRAGLCPGDKLALVTWEKGGEVCCISLIKSGELSGLIKNILGPVMKDILE